MNMLIVKSSFSILISFLVTFYLIPIFYEIALRLRVIDVPDGAIKCHKVATPYLGGVAIFVGFIIALALTFPFDNHYSLFFIGLTLLVFLGLIDDLATLRPFQKFIGQCIVALCFLKAGFYLKERFFDTVWFAIPVSFFWIVSVINAFNLIDIMDGLSSTVAIMATSTFIIISYYYQQQDMLILCSALLGAIVAFFWYNRPIAKIYMGDAGSLFLGGFMSVTPFLFEWSRYNRFGFFTPPLVLMVPLLELLCLVIIRSCKGIPFYKASPDHFALYLRRKGWSVWRILIFVTLFSLVLMFLAVGFSLNHLTLEVVAILSSIAVFGWIATIFLKSPCS